MTNGFPKNPPPNRSDEDRDEANSAHSKKQKVVDPNIGDPNAQLTTTNAISNSATQFVYRHRQGIEGMRQAARQQAQQQAKQQVSDHSGEDLNMLDRNEWHRVTRVKDRNFAATVLAEKIHGTTLAEKKQELQQMLVECHLHCIEGPTRIIVSDKAAFRVTFETQKELETVLEFMWEDEEADIPSQERMFTIMDSTHRNSQLERTVEVYGLHPRIEEFRIRTAMSRFGEIENVTTRPCTKGIKLTASVVFSEVDDVKKIKELGLTSIYVGKDLARLRKIGGEMVNWELRFVAKLSCLPLGTTPMDLHSLLGEGKADFLTVPKIFAKQGRLVRHQREAFVYFPSEKVMEEMTATPVSIGEAEAFWGTIEEKRCRECSKIGHLQRECEIYKEVLKTKEHIRMVKEYQKGGALRVTKERTFAEMAGGSNSAVAGKQQQNGGTQHVTKTAATERKMDKEETTAQPKFVSNMEKKMNTLMETITRLQEEQQKMAAMNQILMQMVITMVSNNMGMSLPTELLASAGLSTDLSRNAMKGKAKNGNGKGVIVDGIPPTNESLAGIMALLPQTKLIPGATGVQGNKLKVNAINNKSPSNE
ncbi:hypothetical protein BGX28_010454 [Mortierella sp. GBA30]|nr:hypothetical protein BGX28_010454 [Mortierella sp. GBA30]